MTENRVGATVGEATIGVHWELGPGLPETVYQVVLARGPQDRGLTNDPLCVSVPLREIIQDARWYHTTTAFRADHVSFPRRNASVPVVREGAT